jgi:hypothetical protein
MINYIQRLDNKVKKLEKSLRKEKRPWRKLQIKTKIRKLKNRLGSNIVWNSKDQGTLVHPNWQEILK